MRKLASIQLIESLTPHPYADTLSLAKVLGWTVVVKTGAFQAGEKAVYIEVDALTPETGFSFLTATKFRVKAVKLRGIVSMGLLVPLYEARAIAGTFGKSLSEEVGDDVTDSLNIKKYEPPVSFERSGACGNFPSFFPKTDETRIQSVPSILEKYDELTFIVREKLEGMSVSFFNFMGEIGVCSRNLRLKPEGSIWETGADIIASLKNSKLNIAIQGEMVGPNINNNIYKLKEHRIFVFNIHSINDNNRFSDIQLKEYATRYQLPLVPLVDVIKLKGRTIENLENMANGQSQLADVKREGLIFRPADPVYCEEIGGPLSFKVISPEYLLKQK